MFQIGVFLTVGLKGIHCRSFTEQDPFNALLYFVTNLLVWPDSFGAYLVNESMI